jgi:hypothetical protein
MCSYFNCNIIWINPVRYRKKYPLRVGFMAEYEYVKGQKDRIEKKNKQLMAEYDIIKIKGHVQRMRKKYDGLMEKKKLKSTDWMDEMMIKVYEDALELEKKKKKKK